MPTNQAISLKEAQLLYKSLTGQAITAGALRYLAPGTSWGIWKTSSSRQNTLTGVNRARFVYAVKTRLALGFSDLTPGSILGIGDHMPGESVDGYKWR